jgi:hypothetical protein
MKRVCILNARCIPCCVPFHGCSEHDHQEGCQEKGLHACHSCCNCVETLFNYKFGFLFGSARPRGLQRTLIEVGFGTLLTESASDGRHNDLLGFHEMHLRVEDDQNRYDVT